MPIREISRPMLYALVAALCATTAGCNSGPPRQHDAEILKRLGVAFEQYASTSKRETWPPMGTGPNLFRPDMDVLAPYIKHDQELIDYLSGNTGVEICYLGYAVTMEGLAHDLLDRWADKGLEITQGKHVTLDQARISAGEDMPVLTRLVPRLHLGVGRFLATIIGNPAGVRVRIPVAWEMPQDQGRPNCGGWVLFMDGHTEWVPSPGRFPMSPDFIAHLGEMRDSPEEDWRTLAAARRSEPIRQAIQPLLDGGILVDHMESRSALALCSGFTCDSEPSVNIEGCKGYRVEFLVDSVGNWLLLEPVEAPVPLSFVVFPYKGKPSNALLGQINWGDAERNASNCTVDLGRGAGLRWFGCGPPAYLKSVQGHLGLRAGQDCYEELVRSLRSISEGRLRRATLFALAQCGEQALPFLEKEVSHSKWLQPEEAAEVLGHIPGTRAGELLRTLCERAPECAPATLILPRKECRSVYLEILRAEARRAEPREPWPPVNPAVYEAAARFCGAEARPVLAAIRDGAQEYPKRWGPDAPYAQLALDGWPDLGGLVRAAVEVPRDAAPRLQDWGRSRGFTKIRAAHLRWSEALDFDTGRVFRLPDHAELTRSWKKKASWMRESGCDVVGGGSLTPCDMTRFPTVRRYGPEPPEGAPPEVEVFRFTTREGAQGVAYTAEGGFSKSHGPATRVFYTLARTDMQWDAKNWRSAPMTENPEDKGTLSAQYVRISEIQGAVLEYAQDHGDEWPDTLEQVLDGGHLHAPDRKAFLAQYDYVRPRISLKHLRAMPRPEWADHRPDYEEAIVINDRFDR